MGEAITEGLPKLASAAAGVGVFFALLLIVFFVLGSSKGRFSGPAPKPQNPYRMCVKYNGGCK